MKAPPRTEKSADGRPHFRIRNAFTLIELLVVIAIIAILVGMGAYVYPQAIDQANKVRTKALISDVVTSVNAYQLEYNRLPVDPSSDENTAIEFDGGEGAAILKVLIGEDSAIGSRSNANPRKIRFMEPDTSSGLSLGVVYEGDDPVKLLDSWGQPLKIVMDVNYDGKIPNPQGTDPSNIRKKVLVWSEGSTNREDADNPWRNNVKSWD